jgi:general secretion pathway protein K
MEDENAKFNINSIIRDNGKTNEEKLSSLKKMLEFLNINQDIALMIADWIDPDSEPRLSDSEDSAKNDFFWSIDELKLVEGLDEHFDILEPYVTIYKNIGTLVYQVNINTAELPVLLSLHDEMTESLAQNIIDARESYPFEDPSDVINVAGLETLGTKLGGRTTVKSTIFRITARATANEITRIIESVMDTSSNVLFWREI